MLVKVLFNREAHGEGQEERGDYFLRCGGTRSIQVLGRGNDVFPGCGGGKFTRVVHNRDIGVSSPPLMVVDNFLLLVGDFSLKRRVFSFRKSQVH